ncbi:hypothetical protein ACFSJ3_15725 [Corallincola platygyrae]|uniref:Integrase n=1 Tax=Corallincola platygyrae TaxID=1193278 RepID=A0ABW4XSI3_9GAMM
MERINKITLDYVDSNYIIQDDYPNEDIIRTAFKSENFQQLENITVIPGDELNKPIKFQDNVWTNHHLIQGRETYRKACFLKLNKKMMLEVKIVGIYLLWFSLRKCKLASIIRTIENIIVIAKHLETIGAKSIFDLDKAPIREYFLKSFQQGRGKSTIDNYFKSLSRMCNMKMTVFGEYGFFLNTNFTKLSPGRNDNQSYCMPMRILNAYWKSYADYFLDLKVCMDSWLYISTLPLKYRKYLDRKGIKHHNNNWLYYLDEFCQPNLKLIYNQKNSAISSLVIVRSEQTMDSYRNKKLSRIVISDGVAKKVDVVSYNRRFPKFLVDMEEIYTFYNRQALIACEAFQAFTGMRKSEATTIKFGSLILERDWVGIRANTYKNSDEGGTEDWWAAPPIVEEIFRKMRLLGECMFQKSGRELNSLYIKTDARRFHANRDFSLMRDQRSSERQLSWSRAHNIRVSTDDLAEFWRLNPNLGKPLEAEKEVQIGALWPISSHQYRRSIAVHVKRLELVSMSHLAIHLKHLGKTISEWYTEGALANSRAPGRIAAAFAKELERADLERAASLAIRFQEGNNLYGKGGKLLEQSKLGGAKTKVYQSFSHAMSLAKRRKSKVMSLGNGMYCMNGQDCDFAATLQSANCRPDCENLVADRESIPIWLNRYKRYRQLYLNSKTKGLPEASQEFFRLEMESYQQCLEFYGVICE